MNVSFSEVTILLSQTVFSLLVANHITKTSEAVPLLGRLNPQKPISMTTFNWIQSAHDMMMHNRWQTFYQKIFSLAATTKKQSEMSSKGFLSLSQHQILNDEERHFLQLHLSARHLFAKAFLLLLLPALNWTHSVTHFAHAASRKW
jgi:hypothetical protein